MREIKFRAWDKVFGMSQIKDICDPYFRWDDMHTDNLNQLEIMQYTGLKDKNGKEIYEGDILRYSGKYEKDHNNYLIKWSCNDSECGFVCNELGNEVNYMLTSVWRKNMEVIGNIYENKELITKGE